MLRKLLTTTALALLVATPAIAQNAAPTMGVQRDLLTSGYMDADNDFLASGVVGQPVYTSAANDADEIGNINDMVLLANGSVSAVIIGVGGFLGMGEKNVAVDVSQLQMVKAEDGTDRWVLETTKEALEAAPGFEWIDEQDAATDTAAVPAVAPMAPADQNAMAPATDMAAAPAAEPNAMAGGIETAKETAATPATGMSPAAPLDRTTMSGLDIATITADQLIGTKVIGPENTEIAEVGDFILSEDGKIDALLVDFGGFLGMGEKRVAVGIDNLEFTTDQNGGQYVWLNVTREQLDAALAYNQETYANERDTQRLVVSAS